jgi:glycine cleavage system H protein
MQHLVVRLGGTRCPDDVARLAAQHSRQPRPGILQGGICAVAHAVRARGVADKFLRRRQPGLPRGGMQRSRSVVVKVRHVVSKSDNIAPRLPDEFLMNKLAKWSLPTVTLTAAIMIEAAKPKTLHYKRSHFVTQLPVDYLYAPAHYWLARQAREVWRVGLTKFATRMLGDMVDCGFDPKPDAPVASGQIIGWVEGFKAISDIYCVLEGSFSGDNPGLKENIIAINKDPYATGWLYEVRGQPDTKCVDVHAYQTLLDQTIDRILEKQKGNESK